MPQTLRTPPSATLTHVLSCMAAGPRVHGQTVSLEVLSESSCALASPHEPLADSAVRLRSLAFRGIQPLVVPFHEWAALPLASSRFEYLWRKLESLVGQRLDLAELLRAQAEEREPKKGWRGGNAAAGTVAGQGAAGERSQGGGV
jgi:hypothetical protein